MSTLRTNRIELGDGSKGVATDFVVDGSAKAWVVFNGDGTPTISASLNISSLTDYAVGMYSATLSSSMLSTSYAVSGSTVGTTVGVYDTSFAGHNQIGRTTDAFAIGALSHVGSYQDATHLQASVVGDLA